MDDGGSGTCVDARVDLVWMSVGVVALQLYMHCALCVGRAQHTLLTLTLWMYVPHGRHSFIDCCLQAAFLECLRAGAVLRYFVVMLYQTPFLHLLLSY